MVEDCSSYFFDIQPSGIPPNVGSATCFTRISEASGTINTPYHPKTYPENLDCVYQFVRYRLEIFFFISSLIEVCTNLGPIQICAECGWRQSNSICKLRWIHLSEALVPIFSTCLPVVSSAEKWISLVIKEPNFYIFEIILHLFVYYVIGFARYQPGATSLEFHFHSDESIGLSGFLISFEQIYDCWNIWYMQDEPVKSFTGAQHNFFLIRPSHLYRLNAI